MKEHEKVLEYVNANGKTRHQDIINKFFDGSSDACAPHLSYLIESGLIEYRPTFDGPSGSYLHPTNTGMSYFLMLKEKNSAVIKQRLWDLFLVFAGVIVGYILGKVF